MAGSTGAATIRLSRGGFEELSIPPANRQNNPPSGNRLGARPAGNAATTNGAPREERSSPRRWWPKAALLLVMTLVFLAVVGRWAVYRHRHVVSHDAVVNGVVTQIGSRFDGRVAEVYAQPNQRVGKGDVLVVLEDRHLRAVVAERQAELRRQRNALELAKVAGEGVLSRRASSALQVRMARLKMLEQEVAVAEARLRSAQVDLSAAKIRAPVNGWVVQRIVEPGGSVKVGDPILSILSCDQVWVESQIDESDLRYVRIGGLVDVHLKALPDKTMTGTVAGIGVLADTEDTDSRWSRFWWSNRQSKVRVRIAIPQADNQMIPGLTAVIGIHKS